MSFGLEYGLDISLISLTSQNNNNNNNNNNKGALL